MKRHKMKETLKKIGAASAAVCLAALFFIMLAVSGHTAPENPMEDKDADASRMYLTSSTLAMDETQLADVENANINTGEEGNKEAQEEKEKEQEEDQAEQGEMQQEDDNAQENQREHANADTSDPSLSTPSKDSLLALIDKHKNNDPSNPSQGGEGPGAGEGDSGNPGDGGPGGNGNKPTEGGEAITLNPEQSSKLFTTNLKDETVDKKEYDLRIELTEKGKKLQMDSQKVTMNNSSFLYQNGDGLTLKKWDNTVSVTLRFRDSKGNQINAATRVYRIIYVPTDHHFIQVKNYKTGEYLKNGGSYTIHENEIYLLVEATKGTEPTNEVLRFDGPLKFKDSDGIYRLKGLQERPYVLRVTAGSVNPYIFTCKITIVNEKGEERLSIDSDAISEGVGSDEFGNESPLIEYKAKSEMLRFRISYSPIEDNITDIQVAKPSETNQINSVLDQRGADGYIQYPLATSGVTKIKVTFNDINGKEQHYTWVINYTADRSESENNKNAPRIKAKLVSEKIDRSPWEFEVAFYGADKRKLSASYAKVSLNGELLTFSGIAGEYYVYTLYLTEGINYLSITLTDDNQYTATKDLAVTFSPDKGSVQVRMILSANVIGLGTMIDEYVTVPAGQTIAQIVNERLEAYGYTPIHDATPTDPAYFLNYIDKPGILDGWSISDEQREIYELQGITIVDPVSNDSLGKDVFAGGSAGWMVTQNNGFIGKSMGSYGVRDGDVLQVMFTINNGADINVDPNSGDY